MKIVPIRVRSPSMKRGPFRTAAALTRITALCLTLALTLTAGAAESDKSADAAKGAEPAKSAKEPAPQVQVFTSMGNFVIELNAERAPLTVAHFLKYVDEGFYSGTIFHRSVAGFIVQGGGYDADYKLKGNPTKVVNESGNGLTNGRGSVGMARSSEPHDSDVQFYVNLADNAALDPNPARWGYAVFGKVVQGMDVVDHIGDVATGARGPFKENAPVKNVIIEKIVRVPASERVQSGS
jgi:cyclophilin family peptidyl-prolyl cis-trans isomerase